MSAPQSIWTKLNKGYSLSHIGPLASRIRIFFHGAVVQNKSGYVRVAAHSQFHVRYASARLRARVHVARMVIGGKDPYPPPCPSCGVFVPPIPTLGPRLAQPHRLWGCSLAGRNLTPSSATQSLHHQPEYLSPCTTSAQPAWVFMPCTCLDKFLTTKPSSGPDPPTPPFCTPKVWWGGTQGCRCVVSEQGRITRSRFAGSESPRLVVLQCGRVAGSQGACPK